MIKSSQGVGLGIAATQMKKPISYLVSLCEQGELSGYVYDPFSGTNGYRQLKPSEVVQNFDRLIFDRAELATLLEQSRMAAETESLAQQLEQERAARQAAELRAGQSEAEAAELRQQLGNAKTAYELLCMQHRAAHDIWAFAQAESTRKEKELADAGAEIERLRQQVPAVEHTGTSPDRPEEAAATDLTFPYATKELKAMRAAVAKYWECYTPDKQQPTQKAIGHTLGELLGLPQQSNGDPARKAIALASAIKPDTLSDA